MNLFTFLKPKKHLLLLPGYEFYYTITKNGRVFRNRREEKLPDGTTVIYYEGELLYKQIGNVKHVHLQGYKTKRLYSVPYLLNETFG